MRLYEPCKSSNCSCYRKRIDIDLAHWRQGSNDCISEELFSESLKIEHLSHYKIIDHKLYYNESLNRREFPSRNSGVEHFLLKIINNLLDTELVINTRDWPQIHVTQKRTSKERDPLVLLSRSDPNIVDAKYAKNQSWRSILQV